MLHHVGTRRLETERLVLRKHRMSDAGDIYHNWAADPEVCRFWQWEPHKNPEETKAYLSSWIEKYANPDYYHWIIVWKSTLQAIGYLYLSDIDDINNSVSVHDALSRTYWNRGIMTEACQCVMHFVFAVLGAERIHSYHHIDNPASGRVLQKSGMHYIQTKYKSFLDCESICGDYCYYEMTSSDWAAAK